LDSHPLEDFRKARNLSRADLGVQIGVTEVTIWRWETRKRVPRGDDLRKLCEVTGLGAGVFVGVEEARSPA